MGYLKYEGTRAGDVYGLVDPRGLNVAYVGKASNGAVARFASHLKPRDTNRSRCAAWVRSLQSQDLEPLLFVLESGEWTNDEIDERERWWIAFFGGPGSGLLNHTEGGDGGFHEGLLAFNQSEWTEERRGRASAAQSAYLQRCRDEGIDIDYSPMAAGSAALHQDPERHAEWAAAIGRGQRRFQESMTEEQRLARNENMKQAAARVDRSFQRTDEYRQKMSESIRSSYTPERRAKISAAVHERWGTEPLTERPCEICGKIFLPGRRGVKTCSRSCTGQLMWQIRRGERERGA